MISELPVFTIEFAIKPECLLEVTHKEAWLDLYLCNIGQGMAINVSLSSLESNDTLQRIGFCDVAYVRPGEKVKLIYSPKKLWNPPTGLGEQEEFIYKMQLMAEAKDEINMYVNFETIDGKSHRQDIYFREGQWFPQSVR
jgi:hypothetical protein